MPNAQPTEITLKLPRQAARNLRGILEVEVTRAAGVARLTGSSEWSDEISALRDDVARQLAEQEGC